MLKNLGFFFHPEKRRRFSHSFSLGLFSASLLYANFFLSFSAAAFSSKLCTQIGIEPKKLVFEINLLEWEKKTKASLIEPRLLDYENKFEKKSDWLTTSQTSLNRHIVLAHFQARTIYAYGLARWDLEIARVRGFNVEWVVKKLYEKLERTDADIGLEISTQVTHQAEGLHAIPLAEFTPQVYRLYLVKTIHLMVDLALITYESVDWDRVSNSFPGAEKVSYSFKTDSRQDGSFFLNHGFDPHSYYKVLRP